MTIPASEIAHVRSLIEQGFSYKQAGKSIGKGKSWVQRRMEAPIQQHDLKPRFRVPVRSYEQPPQPRPEPLYSQTPHPEPASSETIRVMAIGDLHDDPYLSKARFQWLGRMAADLAPDRIVQIGDVADFESLSFHSPNDSDSGRYKPRYMADLASLREALDLLCEPMAAMSDSPRFDLTLGNHENRIWRFEDATPETSGMLQRDFTDILAGHRIAWHKYGAYLKIGGIAFTHAPFSVMGRPIGGVTATQTIARQAECDIVFGHTHKKNVVTTPKIGGESHVTVIDLGCALPWGHVQSYAKHTLTGWWQGAWLLTIRDGHIQGHEAIPMFEIERRYA